MKDVLTKFVSRQTLLSALCLSLGASANAQYISSVTQPDTTQAKITDTTIPEVLYANDINADDLYDHLSILASDEFEGRETGKEGNDKASAYISDFFTSLGLVAPVDGSYFQPIAFTSSVWNETSISVNGNTYKHLWDYLMFPAQNDNIGTFSADEVVFLGYGIDDAKYSDYNGVDVAGKVIMIYKGEPTKADSTSYITGEKQWSEWSTDINKKLILAKSKGVKMVLIIENELKEFLFKNRKYMLGPKLDLGDLTNVDYLTANHAYISSTVAKDIIGAKSKKFTKLRKFITKKGKSKPFAIPCDLTMVMDKKTNLISGKNVIGLLPGSEKADEYVVVSAHYDHLGMKGTEIFNGADDNGSGTSTVLELAESFAKAAAAGYTPKRSIVFMLATGEEKGLLGSEFYAENPIFPLENTMVDVNVDMVGRVDKKYKDNPKYIYVIGSDRLSKDLHAINEEANQKYAHLVLDYTYNDEKDPNRYYYRSDHYNFASRGIPAIFFFNGVHEDYHQPTDTVDKINFDKMAEVGRLIFHTTWELANRDNRIDVLKN